MTRQHASPGPKISEHLSGGRKAKNREQKIDKQVEDSFPASDPPSYSGGNHIVGAPDHESEDKRKKH